MRAWLLSHVLLFFDATDYSPPCSSVHGISQARYWSGLPFRLPGHLPDSGIELTSLASPALAGVFFTTTPPGKPIIYWIGQKVC